MYKSCPLRVSDRYVNTEDRFSGARARALQEIEGGKLGGEDR